MKVRFYQGTPSEVARKSLRKKSSPQALKRQYIFSALAARLKSGPPKAWVNHKQPVGDSAFDQGTPSERLRKKSLRYKKLASGAEGPIHFRRLSGPTEVGPSQSLGES